ncbi:MAG: hypothetical protein WD081_03385 [Gammaproteobacteria bacterium]
MNKFIWWGLLGLAAATGVAAALFSGGAGMADWWLVVFCFAGFGMLVQTAWELRPLQRRAGGALLQGAGAVAVVVALLIEPDSTIATAAYVFGVGGIVLFATGLFEQRNAT